MDGIHIDKGVLEVIRACADVEETSGKFRRLCRRIKCAMIGQCMDAQALCTVPSLSAAISALNMVVATKARTAQILRAVFDPLDRLTRRERCHDRAHIAWIDRHFVAKATTNIRRDNANTMLRQTRHDREEGTMGMRCLRCEPDSEFTSRFIVVRDTTTRLDWRRMNTRNKHILSRRRCHWLLPRQKPHRFLLDRLSPNDKSGLWVAYPSYPGATMGHQAASAFLGSTITGSGS